MNISKGGNANKTNEMRLSFKDLNRLEITWLEIWIAKCGSSSVFLVAPCAPHIGAIFPMLMDRPGGGPMASV